MPTNKTGQTFLVISSDNIPPAIAKLKILSRIIRAIQTGCFLRGFGAGEAAGAGVPHCEQLKCYIYTL